MQRKIVRGISLLFIAGVITLGILFKYETFLDSEINEFYASSNGYNTSISRKSGDVIQDKGMVILQKNAEKNDLFILGSSELSSDVEQNPKNMFPNANLQSNVNLIGHAYVQDLLHTIKIGAWADSLKGKKVVLIVSLQWFLKNEIDKDGYKSNFSELQFYQLINNEKISSGVKKYICERTVALAQNEGALARPYLYAYLYQHDNIFSRSFLVCLKPYYFVREKFLELKDKHDAYKLLMAFNQEDNKVLTRQVDWENEDMEAEKTGRNICTNNEFFVDDQYYEMYLASRIQKLKDSSATVELLDSKEVNDYKVFLQTCSELGIKPYIVFMPTNGPYYDYIGISKDKRWLFYDKLGSLAALYGFDYLDLREKEYQPYFMKDVMHLGWRGWLHVNKEITKYYGQVDE